MSAIIEENLPIGRKQVPYPQASSSTAAGSARTPMRKLKRVFRPERTDGYAVRVKHERRERRHALELGEKEGGKIFPPLPSDTSICTNGHDIETYCGTLPHVSA